MNDVRLLVKKELAAANKKFPMFASAHEGSKIVFGMKFGTTTKFRKRI